MESTRISTAKREIYHQLGYAAHEQRKWEEAEGYYQQALQIFGEDQDWRSQAGTYHQLGRIALEQRKWEEACQYLLQALEGYIDFNNSYYLVMAFRGLARLWSESSNESVLVQVASVMKWSRDEVEQLFHNALEDGDAAPDQV